MTDITLNDLTTGALNGTGVFDKLMASSKAHLEDQFLQSRIKGPEYASVYLGQVQQALQTAVSFLAFQQKAGLEAQLLEQQVLLAKVQVEQANAQTAQITAQTELVRQQTANALAEHALIVSNADKVAAEIAQLTQQTKLVAQNTANAAAEALNIPKQGLVLDAQQAQIAQQTANAVAENANIVKQGKQLDAQTALTEQQKLNAIAEAAKITADTLNVPKQGLLIDAQAALAGQQKENEILQGKVLVAQECLLRAQYDGTLQTTLKSAAEASLLAQKIVTEKAQTLELGVDENSVIGRQKALYQAQKEGFTRDAEQKAVKIWTDTWNARRMTDEGTVADATNMLNDAVGGRLMNKLLSGIQA